MLSTLLIIAMLVVFLFLFSRNKEFFEVYKGEVKPFGYGYRPYFGYRPYLYDGYNVNSKLGFTRPILTPTVSEDVVVPVGYDYWNNSRNNSMLPQYNPSEIIVGVNYYNVFGLY